MEFSESHMEASSLSISARAAAVFVRWRPRGSLVLPSSPQAKPRGPRQRGSCPHSPMPVCECPIRVLPVRRFAQLPVVLALGLRLAAAASVRVRSVVTC